MPVIRLLAAAAFGLAAIAPAHAQFAKPDDALKYRQSVMYLQSQHLGRIARQLRAEKPDLPGIAENAAVLDTMNKLFASAFPPDSEGVGNSRALPAVWKEPEKFKQGIATLNGQMAKLLAASRGNDLAGTRAAFNEVRQTCGSCHDAFRRE